MKNKSAFRVRKTFPVLVAHKNGFKIEVIRVTLYRKKNSNTSPLEKFIELITPSRLCINLV